jgi:hypothetical protein
VVVPGDALLDLVYGQDDRDVDWKPKALCMKAHDGVSKDAWTCDEKGRVKIAGVVVPAVRAQQMAADICFGCPVQWACVYYYIAGDEKAGVWGMTPRDMKKFRDTCRLRGLDPLVLVDAAEKKKLPVQVMVRRLVASV